MIIQLLWNLHSYTHNVCLHYFIWKKNFIAVLYNYGS
jgi:hypothetical protein